MEQIARDYGTDPAPAEGSGVLPVKTMTQTQIGAIGEVTVAAQLMLGSDGREPMDDKKWIKSR